MNKKCCGLHFNSEYSYQYILALSLIPMLLYGIYKNGVLPYLNQDTTWIEIFRPILFPLIGVITGIMVDLVFWWGSKSKTIWNNTPFYGGMIGFILPIEANLFVTGILLFSTFSIIRLAKSKKISPLFLGALMMLIILISFGNVPFENKSELTHQTIYSISDLFFGRNIAGVCSTSIFFILVALIFLSFDYYYKKEISISILGTYLIFTVLLELLFPTGDLLRNILNSNFFFASVFIAPDIEYTPYMEKGKILYGISVGVISVLLTRFLSYSLGIYYGIFLVSLATNFFDNLAIQLEKNDNLCRNEKNNLKIQ